LLGMLGCLLGATSGHAQSWPSRPVTVFVTAAAGGVTDVVARAVGAKLSELWGQPVVIENKGGAAHILGAQAVAKAAPDGHTLLVNTISFAITAGLQKLPYDPIRDFAPITELATLPLMLVVHPSVPANNLEEFIALGRANPGGWHFASSGIGTSPHLAAEMFKSAAGIDLVHVPYKGNAEAMNALLGGHVKIYFALVPAALQHVKTGSVRALAVTTETRLPYLPEVPTIAERGFSGYEISSWQGAFAPAGTPNEIVAKISGELARMLDVPEIRTRISREGADPMGSTPDAFAARVKSEIAKWSKVIKASGIATSN
jgi:tripartite-type tricarboxylate transporter receptor subunit TctC